MSMYVERLDEYMYMYVERLDEYMYMYVERQTRREISLGDSQVHMESGRRRQGRIYTCVCMYVERWREIKTCTCMYRERQGER
jgi:hypothetical protein